MQNWMEKIPGFKNQTPEEIRSALIVFLFTLVIFCLHTFVGKELSFYIFYFPSVAAMAWYFGKGAGWSMVFLCTLLWFVKQWNLRPDEIRTLVFLNGIICFTSFCTICWMTLAIRSAQIKLRERSQELEEFASKAAHELQAPATNILGYVELLDEKFSRDGASKEKGFSQKILKNLERMTILIKELLDYSRVEKREMAVSPVDLEKALKETLEVLSPLIVEKQAEVSADPLPTVNFRPWLAAVLFQNLITNAIKYCEQKPRIHISAVRRGGEWLFSVKDNGIGIPEKYHKHIFLMFKKIPSPQEYPGYGIGLATCQKILVNYGGRIWVESKPGKGSTFFFTLPAGQKPSG